jgi:hypothetical protein
MSWNKCRTNLRFVLAVSAIVCGCGHRYAYPDLPALTSLRHIQEAEELYLQHHGRYGNLSELAFSSPDLVNRELAQGRAVGHTVVLRATDSTYVVQTEPIEWGRTGFRSFYSDQTQVVHQSFGPALATVSDLEL